MKYEYNYDHTQGSNLSTIRSVLECIGESIGHNNNCTIKVEIAILINTCENF